MTSEIALIIAGGFAGGFINGLSGLGMALAGMALWVHVLPPVVAAPLAAACGAIGQVQALPLIRHALHWPRLLPFLLGGLVGIPFGTWLLATLPLASFKLWVGAFIVTYCMVRLATGSVRTTQLGGRAADGLAGLTGGVLGGFAGLSGPVPTIWAGLRPWSKDERRAVIQIFNLVVLLLALVAQTMAGLVGRDFVRALVLAAPAAMIGSLAGQALYKRLSDHHFDRMVLGVLLVAGLILVVSS
jgi:hypothetical protein